MPGKVSSEERLVAVQEELAAAIERTFESDDWRAALATAAKFHNYSFDNAMLIYAQHSNAFRQGLVSAAEPSMVAGYRQWQAMGRHVTAGQHGYAILRPNRLQWRETLDPGGSEWRRLGRGERAAPGAPERKRSRLHPRKPFGLATVFDVSQTEGEPVPQPPTPLILAGSAREGLWEGLAARVADQRFSLRDTESAQAIGGANGVTDWKNMSVTIRSDMDDAARVKTLSHELGHVLLHDPRSPDGEISLAAMSTMTRGAKEVEAESVAYLIGAAHGMDTTDYSLPYISTWASREDGMTTVRQVGARVVATARSVLDQLPTQQWGTGQPPGLQDRLAEQRHTEQRSTGQRNAGRGGHYAAQNRQQPTVAAREMVR